MPALNEYFAYLTNIQDEAVIKEFAAKFVLKKFPKKSFFLQPGEVCDEMAVLTKGMVHGYYEVDKKTTRFLLLPNQFFTDLKAFISGTKSQMYIQFLQSSEVLIIKKQDLKESIKKHTDILKLQNRIYEESLLQYEKRAILNAGFEAERRLQIFYHEYPHLKEILTDKMIAEFLDIRPETLSRIKRKHSS